MGMESNMRKETCQAVLGMYKRLRTKTYNNHYHLIAEYMTDENLRCFGDSVMGEEVLLWASHKLALNSLYLFWERILRNRKCFSDAFIASIWYEMFISCKDRRHQHPVEENGTESDFGWQEIGPNDLAKSIITSPYLLDNSTVINRYCQARKQGWETLRYIRVGRQWNTLPGWNGVRQEIAEDCAPGFGIKRTMMGCRLTFSIIAEILDCGAFGIFRHLLENELQELEEAVPLEEIACHVVAQFPDSQAIPVLDILEEARPGIVGGFHDVFGQNLLWYELTNVRTCWFHPNCQLTTYLLEHGCSPDAPMNIGLSWRNLTNALDDQKKSFLWGRKFSPRLKLMEQSQPNIWNKK